MKLRGECEIVFHGVRRSHDFGVFTSNDWFHHVYLNLKRQADNILIARASVLLAKLWDKVDWHVAKRWNFRALHLVIFGQYVEAAANQLGLETRRPTIPSESVQDRRHYIKDSWHCATYKTSYRLSKRSIVPASTHAPSWLFGLQFRNNFSKHAIDVEISSVGLRE